MFRNNYNKNLRKVRKYKAVIAWRFVIGFSFGIFLSSFLVLLVIFLSAKTNDTSFSAVVKDFTSFDFEREEAGLYSYDESLFMNVINVRQMFTGDYDLSFSLSESLQNKCQDGYCRVVVEVYDENESSYRVAGPSKKLGVGTGSVVNTKILNSLIGENGSGEMKCRLEIGVYSIDGLLVARVEEVFHYLPMK